MKPLRSMLAVLIVSMVLSSPSAASFQAETPGATPEPRTAIRSQAEMPPFSYALLAPPSTLLDDEAAFEALTTEVGRDLDALMAGYDIEDATTLISIHAIQRDLALLRGEPELALAHSASIRQLETKPASQVMAGVLEDAGARAVLAGPEKAEREAAFRRHIDETLEGQSWALVRNDVLELKNLAEMLTDTAVLGIVRANFDPMHADSGSLSLPVAAQLVRLRTMREFIVPYADSQLAAFDAHIAQHDLQKPDIWASRDIDLEQRSGWVPVVVGVWDSGIDTSLFPGQMHVNPAEQENGRDDDGNGFVDDVHGIAFDQEGNRSTGMLLPLAPEERAREAQLASLLKGSLDAQYQVDSPEAASFRSTVASLQPDEFAAFGEGLALYADYAHGTHVASVAAAGNPAARLLVVRDTVPHQLKPPPFTRETARGHARMYADIVGYLDAQGARVVNMGWLMSPRQIERSLEANGLGGTPEERRAEALATFAILSDALTGALRSAPEILFVAPAGNSDDDIEFNQLIPAGVDLPNVLTVGGVDRAGDEVPFTSHGRLVRVHANAHEIDGLVPGGGRMSWSGTSMAAPQVTNLAAKLFSLDPTLTVAKTVELIVDGAEGSEDGRRHLIHPQRSAELLAQWQGQR